MTILFWPRDADEPLPTTSGVVIGWKQDKDTVICARILHHKDNALMQTILNQPCDSGGLQLLGKWDPTDYGKTWPADDLPTFEPTPLGPWWVDQRKKETDLLVYYSPNQIYNLEIDDTQLGFAPILERLNQVEKIVERLTGIRDDEEHSGNRESSLENDDRPASVLHRYSLLYNHFHDSSLLERIPLLRLLGKVTSDSNSDPCMTTIDLLLGALTCIVILSFADHCQKLLSMALNSDEQLRAAILWLENFPAGFKLNEPLTRNMGRELLHLLDYWHHHVLHFLLGSSGQRVVLLQCLGLTSLTFGLSTMLALVVDIVQVVTLHLTMTCICFAKVHQFQVYMLGSLWKLFQGKKRNPLRGRTDTMEYDSMQLLVGMLVFTSVLFLFTTILVYYVFFSFLYIALQPVGLWLFYGFVQEFPLHSLWKRWRNPSQMGVGIYLEEQSPSTVWLRVIPKSYATVLGNFAMRYPGRIVRLVGVSLAKLATGQRLAMLRDCISDRR